MSTEPPVQPFEQPMAPPTMRYAVPLQPPVPVWPTVVGIISIIFGVGGLLGGILGYVMYASSFTRLPSGAPVFNEMQRDMMPVTLLSTLVAVLLLIAGIGLLRRSHWSVPLARVWAVIKMIAVIVGVIVGVMLQPKQFAAMSAQGAMPPGVSGLVSTFAIVGALFALVWGWALPVFMLFWLSRAKIKAEVAGWR